MSNNYVYVYIDPRNFEEFYYGKGKDDRKDAHLFATGDSEKISRIQAIRDDKQEPIIRVIARGLTEAEAFLVEKTLIWKLGKNLLNKSSGSGGYADKFRPDNKMHLELPGFDYVNGIYYFNVGEYEDRQWTDCKRYGFIAAGGGDTWREAIRGFREGDIFAAYLKGSGFVGVGRVTQTARPIREISIAGQPLLSLDLAAKNMDKYQSDQAMCDHIALVEWIRSVDRHDAKWLPKSGLYTTTHVRASLAGQAKTIQFINEQFDIDLHSLIEKRADISN